MSRDSSSSSGSGDKGDRENRSRDRRAVKGASKGFVTSAGWELDSLEEWILADVPLRDVDY